MGVSQLSLQEPEALLRALYDAAVQRALPAHTLSACLPTPPKGRTLVLGAGKAGGAMAQPWIGCGRWSGLCQAWW